MSPSLQALCLALCLAPCWGLFVPVQNVLVPFSSQVRERLLYTGNQKQGLFVEMKADGSVSGSSVYSPDCLLELRSVRAGETVIRGMATARFLCMNDKGKLRGQVDFVERDCVFHEVLGDGYSSFYSTHNGLRVSLHPKSGQKHGAPLSRFLPLVTTQTLREDHGQFQERTLLQQDVDLDSDNPFGMGHRSHIHAIFSPSLHRKK